MKKRWICLLLTVIMLVSTMPIVKAVEAVNTTFIGTYEQVRGFIWEADDNTITFNSDNTFTASVNMYEGFFEISGNYNVKLNQAFCTITKGSGLDVTNFTMTDINGNLIFEATERIVSIRNGALFNKANTLATTKSPWEDAYMDLIKPSKNVYSTFSFALYDVDEDGTPELFLTTDSLTTVYTYKNGKSVSLGTVNHFPYMWDEKNSFITFGGMGSGASGAMLYKIENGQLSEGEIVFYEEWRQNGQSGTYIINGRSVSEDVYKAEIKAYINPSRSIYTLYCYNIYNIISGTRLADYVTARKETMNFAAANPTSSAVLINGSSVVFQAYTINQSNYFKLRDLAKVLSGTSKQFSVGYDPTTKAITLTSGQPYAPVGGELTGSGVSVAVSAIPSQSIVYLNGQKIDLTAYTISGNNYFKLRDIGKALDFGVTWDGTTNTIKINTSIGYSE